MFITIESIACALSVYCEIQYCMYLETKWFPVDRTKSKKKRSRICHCKKRNRLDEKMLLYLLCI